jgi:hypothetical protein
MATHIHRLSAALLTLMVVFAAPPAWSIGLSEKAGLQAAMQRHIDRQLVDGAFLHLDLKTGVVRQLHPVSAHPIILRMGKHYVLCFNFRDEKGKEVEIDFYLARQAKSYVVFHTAVSSRHLLKRLMSAGRVVRSN